MKTKLFKFNLSNSAKSKYLKLMMANPFIQANHYIFHAIEKSATTFLDLQLIPTLAAIKQANLYRIESTPFNIQKLNQQIVSFPLSKIPKLNVNSIYFDKSFNCIRQSQNFEYDHQKRLKSSLLNGSSKKIQHIVHLRDFRDMVVSSYHSIKYSHKENPIVTEYRQRMNNNEITLEDFYHERWQKKIKKFINSINQASFLPNISIVKYEDMVTNFEKYLQNLLIAMDIDNKIITAEELSLFFKDEFKPDGNHKRRILPGGGKDELSKNVLKDIQDMISSSKILSEHYP